MLRHPLLRRIVPQVRRDLSETYARNLHKWLLIAPIIGLSVGLVITLVATLILRLLWPPVLRFYLAHPWTMLPGITLGCAGAGLLMQKLTPNPNQHSTEEIIHAYHEEDGVVDTRPLPAKLAAAVATVGFGGSAALEGPSIYGGAAIGSWFFHRLGSLRRFRLTPRDRRIMLICGAAAGMSAVFRAPLTGIVFALEMPYKDDMAHEALLPSLLASVVSYFTLGTFLGSAPLFDFPAAAGYSMHDLVWSALLGLAIGLLATAYVLTFRHLRGRVVRSAQPHWLKLAIGGALTAMCGLAFLALYPGRLVPIGPNYEAVSAVISQPHGSVQLVAFAALKLAATAFTLGAGGVSAMFVPIFLSGGALGVAFSQSVVHSPAIALYAAVGMASFIAAAYKTPLAAAVFVAEATGGHAFLIPALIGAAVAYSVSGDASISADQRLHEGPRQRLNTAAADD
ncbi:MAG: chloride channel protein [Acidobacteriota bacterium]|nr:chloride channel protein [Acidobacteriota bacterium]